jgi:hypothetical protein
MNDREEFEKWAQDSYLLQECGDGRYASKVTQLAYEAWQAALEAERQSKKAMSEANDRIVWGD